jgi:hypothetical protein
MVCYHHISPFSIDSNHKTETVCLDQRNLDPVLMRTTCSCVCDLAPLLVGQLLSILANSNKKAVFDIMIPRSCVKKHAKIAFLTHAIPRFGTSSVRRIIAPEKMMPTPDSGLLIRNKAGPTKRRTSTRNFIAPENAFN